MSLYFFQSVVQCLYVQFNLKKIEFKKYQGRPVEFRGQEPLTSVRQLGLVGLPR